MKVLTLEDLHRIFKDKRIVILECITPEKVIHKKHLVKYVIDDWSEEQIRKEFEGLKV
jgi:hypothetical protein